MSWNDIQTVASPCLQPADWNAMVVYIESLLTSTCTDSAEATFTLYTDCDGKTGQKFKFSYDGDDSIIEGGDTANQDLILKANSSDTYSYILISGAAGVIIDVPDEDEIRFFEGGDQFITFDRSGIISEICGGADTGDELKVGANCADAYPYILLDGDSNITLYSTADISFYEQAVEMFRFKLNGAISEIWGSRLTGNDFYLYANQIDECSAIQLFGNSGISNKIKAGSIFDVSSCSGEAFFEIDTSTPSMHINHHCLQAYEFRLENRWSDPSSPTCVGRMWLRVDLI